jgi:hypothetical protein
MRPTILLAAAAAAALGLSGCGDKGASSAGTETAAAPEPDASDMPDCKVEDLSLVFIGKSSDGNQQTATYALQNDGKANCALHGFPSLVFRSGNNYAPIGIKRAMISPHLVGLKPGGHAEFEVVSLLKDTPCVKDAHARVNAPVDGKKDFDAKDGVDVCGAATVSPLHRPAKA